MLGKSLLLSLLLIPFIGAFLSGLSKNYRATLSGGTMLLCFIITIVLYPFVLFQEKVTIFLPWESQLYLILSFSLDGLSWLFSFLIFGIGSLVSLYSYYYLNKNNSRIFYCILLLFASSINIVILSSNLIILYLFWELTSIFSFFLIGYEYKNYLARRGALMSLIVTNLGGISMFFSFILMGGLVGSFQIEDILANAYVITNHKLYPIILISLLLGALSKSAIFPLHFWLPNAMVAPTPVSTYLHSATLVNMGVFLLLRFSPAFSSTEMWFYALGITGMSSLLLGSFQAIFQQDLKKILAYSTIGNIGLIVTLLSLGTALGSVAAIFHLMNHAIFKASLFMSTGVIAQETGTRDIRQLKGLYAIMPTTAKLIIVASAAMAGVPLLNGFLSKEMFFYEASSIYLFSWLDTILPYVAVLAAILTVVYSLRIVVTLFEQKKHRPNISREPEKWMRFPIEFLVFLCLMIGVFPNLLIGSFLHNASYAILKEKTPIFNLQLWHGFSPAVLMSFLTFVIGVGLYLRLRKWLNNFKPNSHSKFSSSYLFSSFLDIFCYRTMVKLRYLISPNGLQGQLRIFLIFTLCLTAIFLPIFSFEHYRSENIFPLIFFTFFSSLWVVMCIYTSNKKRLSSFIFLNLVGLSVCFTFVLLSAPDLALAQILVDLIITLLTISGLYWIPEKSQNYNYKVRSNRLNKYADAIIAIFSGIVVTILAYALMYQDVDTTIGDYFLKHAYKETNTQNSVTALLSGFRSFDTLGEILVLLICSLIVFAALTRLKQAKKSIFFEDSKSARPVSNFYSNNMYVPSLFMSWTTPFIFVLSLYILFQGHSNTGGGFPGGIILSLSMIVQYIALGDYKTEEKLKKLALSWVAGGVLLMCIAGVIPTFWGDNFLTLWHYEFVLPFWGELEISSMVIFDAGVFIIVAGVVILVLTALTNQSFTNQRSYVKKPAKKEVK